MTQETMNKINIGAEIVDVVFKALGIPVSFSSKIKLIENVMSAGETNPKIQLRNNIADSIDKIVKESKISDVDAEAVKDNVKESLEKVTEKDYIDNISSPQSLVDKIINKHTDLSGTAEECYQSIIKSVVNALCTNNNIAIFVNEGLMLAALLKYANELQIDLTNLNKNVNELSKYTKEKFLLKSEIKIENTDNAFSYSNSKVGFYGRGAEVNKIDEFMNCDKPFTFWSITGYGGMGKSKLAYNIAKKYDKQNWTVIWYDSNNTDIDKIFGKDFVHNVLFIVDYAGSKIDAVRKIITKSIAKTKNQDENRIIHIRLLMVERDDYSKNGSMNYSAIETWYQKIFNCQDFDGKKNFEYKNEPNKSNKPLNLSAINDTEALYNIIDDFTVNVKGEKQKLNNSKKDEIIDFVRNKLCQTEKDSHFADRCIFILFTTDAVLSGKDIKNWDTAKLLENYLKRFERILPNANNMRNHKQLLAFATAVGGIDIDDCKNYVFAPYIEKLENDFSNDDDLCDAIRTLCEKECEKGVADTLITPLQPDLVGEYNFIYEMQCIRSAKKKKELLKTFLSKNYIDYFCTFMERCYADWYNEEYLSTLTDMIINIIIEMDDENIALQYSKVLFTITYNVNDYTVNLSYAEKIDKLLEKYQTEIIALAYAKALVNVSNKADNYDKSLKQADKINELLKEYETPEIALAYAQALVNVSGRADNYDKSLKQANKINELLKYYKTPEIALAYAQALVNVSNKADNYDKSLKQANKINELLKYYKTPEIALEYAQALVNVSAKTNNYNERLEQADKISELLKEYKTPEIALKYTQALVNVSNKADNYDKSLKQANKINELLKYYKTPEIALEYAKSLFNATCDTDNSDVRLEQADKINKLLKEYQTPEIALEYAKVLFNATCDTDNSDVRLEQANKINELLKYYKTPEIALAYAQALVNVSKKADNYDKRLEQVNKINELLKYYKTPEIALAYARSLVNTANKSDNCNTITSYKTAIYNLYQEYKILDYAECYAMILAILSFNLDTADEIRNICLAGINEIKADGFNSERIEEIEKIINDNLSKKLKDNL
ncbi:MAG: hypothetical protein MR981_06490 [Ruminococcus bromii]|nr:hypothetical protein [Ruminococcus bromii]